MDAAAETDNKELMHVLESTLITWTKQIKNVLKQVSQRRAVKLGLDVPYILSLIETRGIPQVTGQTRQAIVIHVKGENPPRTDC